MLIKFGFFIKEAFWKMKNNEEAICKVPLCILVSASFSIFEKNSKYQFLLVQIAFGTYNESRLNSVINNLVRSYNHVKSCNFDNLKFTRTRGLEKFMKKNQILNHFVDFGKIQYQPNLVVTTLFLAVSGR